MRLLLQLPRWLQPRLPSTKVGLLWRHKHWATLGFCMTGLPQQMFTTQATAAGWCLVQALQFQSSQPGAVLRRLQDQEPQQLLSLCRGWHIPAAAHWTI